MGTRVFRDLVILMREDVRGIRSSVVMSRTSHLQMDLGGAFKEYRLYSSRFQGSKRRVMPWLMESLSKHLVSGDRVLDAYAGSGVVTYALTSRGLKVTSSDQLLSAVVTVQALSGKSRDLEPKEITEALMRVEELKEIEHH